MTEQKPHRRRSDFDSADAATLRALVVDDDENYRFLLASLVGRFGFSVTSAGDGEQAIEIMANAPLFDLLIIDCEMPRLDGLELIGRIRSDEEFAEIYAMMITAREDVDTKITALRLGYDDFLTKSATEVEIAAKLSAARRLVTRQRRLDHAVRELTGLAQRDELTGLFNRRHFFIEADRMLAEGRIVNLVLFDLDNFKSINDTFGHQAGDRILHDIGAMFLARTRRDDLVARYGGDEFVMLVPDLMPADIEPLAERVSEDLAELEWSFEDATFSVGLTAGIACSSLLEQPTVAHLLTTGDRDLYKNKWLRKHPGIDPTLYEYDTTRDALVVDFMREHRLVLRSKE